MHFARHHFHWKNIDLFLIHDALNTRYRYVLSKNYLQCALVVRRTCFYLPRGGSIISRCNDIRDITAVILNEALKKVTKESILQPLAGESENINADWIWCACWCFSKRVLVSMADGVCWCEGIYLISQLSTRSNLPFTESTSTRRKGIIMGESLTKNSNRSQRLCVRISVRKCSTFCSRAVRDEQATKNFSQLMFKDKLELLID